MENRILTLKRTLLAFFTLLLFAQAGWSQHFIIVETVPDTIYVDGACEATLEWALPDIVGVSPAHPGTGQIITFFDIVHISGGYELGDLIPPATNVDITYLAEDNEGNDSLFTFDIDFLDNIAPVIDVAAVPVDVTVSCSIPAPPVVNATDNCDGTFATIVTDAPVTIDYCIGGTMVRTFSATDAGENTSTETQNITVMANGGPTVSAGFLASIADVTVSCDMIPVAPTLTAADISDDCTLPADVMIVNNGSETINVVGLTCPTTQLITRIWTLEDDCGLLSNSTQTITVQDNTAPVITPPATTNVTIQCTGVPTDPETQILSYENNFTVSDNCSPVNWSNDYTGLTGGMCAGTGTATVNYTASDGCNSANVTINFTVEDSNSPNITTGAQDEEVDCDGNGNITDLNNWLAADGNAIAMDGCSPSGLVQSVAVLSDMTTDDPIIALANAVATGCTANLVAVITVQFTFTDDCGNMSTTDADFSIVDNDDPTITTPASDETVECDGAGNTTDLNNWLAANGNAVGSDVCSGTAVTWRTDPAMPIIAATCGNEGFVAVAFYVSDECGNENPTPTSATFRIEDTVNPMWTISPTPLTIECDGTIDPGGQIATWLGNNGNGSATDGCNPGLVTYSDDYTAIVDACGESGSVDVVFTASDGCGNSADITATLTIEDTTPPNWTVDPMDLTVECDGTTDPGGQIASWLANVGNGGAAYDNCGGAVSNFTNNYAGLSDECGATGTATVTFTANDACGLTSTRTATVTIEDTTAPAFPTSAQALNVECDANTASTISGWLTSNGNAVVSEACGTVTWSNDYVGYSAVCPGTGTATVTFTATDECGFSASTMAIITVSDTQNPIFTTPPSSTQVQCSANVMTEYAAWLASHGGGIASDACSTIDNSTTSTNWSYIENGSTPDCPNTDTGVNNVTFTVTDDCGLTQSLTVNFTIIDDTSPTIFPTSTSMTEECGSGDDQTNLEAWIDSYGGAIAADGCSAETWIDFDFTTNDGTPVMGTVNFGDNANYPQVTANDCQWSVAVTFRVRDECSNTSTTTSSFIIDDTTDPVLAAIPADITVDCQAPAPIMPTATDNCAAIINIVLVADTVTTCANSYVVTRTWTAMDDCGNTDSDVRVITVEDNTAPMVTAPADVTVECDLVPVPGTPTVTDMCDINPTIVFTTNTVPGTCPNEYVITRTWMATDACGNMASDNQVITVQDNTLPTITGILPVDITVACNAIPTAPVVGTDILGADNCGLGSFDYLESTTQGVDADMCSFYEYTLTRTWTAIDLCGNTMVHIQMITVEDNNDPSFTIPVDLLVDCEDVNNLAITGQPINVSDGCDNTPDVTFVDNITVLGSCPFNYTLARTWTVTDACGNLFSDVQTILVQDVTDPTFGNIPQGMTMVCVDDMSADAAYANWVTTYGGGTATDNCGMITWYVLEPGSYDINDEATFITAPTGLGTTCPSPTMGIYRTDDVSFVAVDECGNAIEQTVTFTVTDDTPPVFTDCPVDVIFDNDPGICGVVYALNPPLITDECASSFSIINVTVMEPFVSPNPGDDQTIVNPITLNIGPLPINPAVATVPVTLTINLGDYDGEDVAEFFDILGEDGTNLGQTDNSTVQCGSSTTILTLSASQVNDWASADGFLTITLLPNQTVNPIFAINDICPQGPPTGGGSTASATIDYTSVAPNGLTYEYSIDNGSRVQVSLGTVVPYTFDVGTTLVTYYATDCAGNESLCSYNVTVNDNELPTMSCPSDMTVSLPVNADCTVGASVDLFPPTNIFDNCGFQNMFSQVQPQTFNQSLLTFSYNPNYLDYVADDKSFSFTGIGANAVNGNVTFTVRVEGDVEDSDEFFEIYGEDGSLLGTTQAGQPNVNVTAVACPALSISVTTITVPVAIFNAWALDGQVDINAVSNSTFGLPPAGITGDGISPACTVFASGTPDGTADGESNLTVVLDYTSVTPTYFATGATTIGNSIFPVPLASVTHNLNIGVTTVTYQIEDVNGNVRTCAYDITIEDNIAPLAICQGTTVYVTPDGGVYTLDPLEIDDGSSDNCGIVSMTVSPNTFDCTDLGNTINVTLEVTDDAGNTSTCAAPVNVQTVEFFPSFSVGLCGNTDLNLFANAPVGMYTFEWAGPNGFVSFDENPIIPNAAPAYSGTFLVTITGQGGCEATGAVTLTINSSPNTPIAIIVVDDICTTDDIVIEAQSYSGTIVTYSWYEGVSPTGVLLGTTQVPNYMISNPAAGTYSYYVIVDVDACQTNPSGVVTVDVSDSPVITIITNTQIDCASGDEDMILTPTVTPVSPDYLYEWVGPNGFYSTLMNATLPDVSSADNGSYTLIVTNGAGGCQSAPYTHVISVDDLPQTPIITSVDNQLCEGDLLQLQLVNNPYVGANITYNWTLPNTSMVTTSVASLTFNAATITEAGNYSVFVIVDGCTSDVSGMFAVNVNSIPTAPVASYNGPVCEGTALQLTTDFIPGASYLWTGPNNFSSTNQNPLVSPADQTDEGTYLVSIVVNGCPSASSPPLLVEVNDIPDAVLTANNGPICLDDLNAILELSVTSASAIPGATYTWYQASTNTIVGGPTTSLTTTVSDLTPYSIGANDFYVVISVNGCLSSASASTTVQFDFTPTNGAFAGNDIFVCDNNSVVLSAQAPTIGSGEWVQTSGSTVVIANPNQSTSSVVGLSSGQSYTFAWILSNGSCIGYAIDEVSVDVSDSPVVTIITNTQIDCASGNEDMILTPTITPISPDYLYEWVGPNGFYSTSMNATLPDVSSADNGSYTLIVTNGIVGCQSNPYTHVISVDDLPPTPIITSLDNQLCEGDLLQLQLVNNPYVGANITYNWTLPNTSMVITSVASLTFNAATINEAGNYLVSVTVDGCTSDASGMFAVNVNSIPGAPMASYNGPVCEGTALQLTTGFVPGATYFWTGPNNFTSTSQSPLVFPADQTDEGIYFVSIVVNGCPSVSSEPLLVEVNDGPEAVLAVNNGSICLDDPNAILELSVTSASAIPGANYTWYQASTNTIVGGPTTSLTTTVSDLTPYLTGANDFYVVASVNGCPSSASVPTTVQFDFIPTNGAFAGNDIFVCDNNSVVLNAQAPTIGSGEWVQTSGSMVIIANPNQSTSSVVGLNSGQSYTFAWMLSNGSCMNYATDEVIVDVSDSPVITIITNTQIDCASGDEDMILTSTVTPVSPDYSYEWVGPNGFYSTSMNATLPDVSSVDNGSYTLIVTNEVVGCESDPYTHVISVDDLPQTPIITSLDNQLCEGDLLQLQLVNNPYVGANITYNWTLPNTSMVATSVASLTFNAATINEAGNYLVSVTVDGCTSDASGMFAVNVNSIPGAPVASYSGPVCEGAALQLTTDFVLGATYFWTGPNNFNSTSQNPLVFPADQTDEGTYFVSIVVNGCPSALSPPLLVEVNGTPEAVLAVNNGPICLDDPNAILELSVTSASAIPGANYTWYQASTSTIVGGPTTSLTTTVSDLTPYLTGANDFYAVASVNGCLSSASVPTIVQFDFTPTNGAFAGNDIFVCDNSSIVLNAQAPTIGSGEWAQTSGSIVVIANPNQSTTSIVGLNSGQSYTFAWILSNGSCMGYATDEVTVTVDVAVAAADAGTDIQTCNATEINLNAIAVTGGITGTWTQPSSQALLGVTIVNVSDPNTLITGLMPGNNYQFIWKLSNAGCGDFSSDIVVITNESTIGLEAFAGNDIDLCGNEETPLAADPAETGSTGIWTTAGGATIISPSQPNTFVADLEIGANIFIWTLSKAICGDYSSDEITIFYEPTPTANDDSYEISYNGSLDLNVLANDDIGGYTITYTNPTNGKFFGVTNGVFSYSSNLVYVGADEFIYEICSDICPDECSTATVTLTVGEDATCEIPTIFTPNNDGINDEFIIPCLSTDKYPQNEVSIFNQWGDEVFRQSKYQNDWYGTYKGEEIPTGTYFWVIDLGDGTTPTSGFLILER
jgi:gliding motility-associated-like protein